LTFELTIGDRLGDDRVRWFGRGRRCRDRFFLAVLFDHCVGDLLIGLRQLR